MMKLLAPYKGVLLWLKITAFALISGAAIGTIVFCYLQTQAGLFLGIAIAGAVTILGMILATMVCKKHSDV